MSRARKLALLVLMSFFAMLSIAATTHVVSDIQICRLQSFQYGPGPITVACQGCLVSADCRTVITWIGEIGAYTCADNCSTHPLPDCSTRTAVEGPEGFSWYCSSKAFCPDIRMAGKYCAKLQPRVGEWSELCYCRNPN